MTHTSIRRFKVKPKHIYLVHTPPFWSCGHKRSPGDKWCLMCEKLDMDAMQDEIATEDLYRFLHGQEAVDEVH